MTRVLVFGPHVPGDPALENSRWIATQHIKHFGERGLPIIDGDATRLTLEAALAGPTVGGAVLCGHGDGGKELFLLFNQHHDHDETWHRKLAHTSDVGAVYGSDDEPALDHRNVHLAANRWIHALACEVGMSKLPEAGVNVGVIAFAAYEQRLVPEFTIESLPESAVTILRHIVTLTTERLSEGQFDNLVLTGEVRRASEALDEWFESEEGAAWMDGPGAEERVGLTKFTKQLSSALRILTKQ